MNILLCAYECDPERGSEYGRGWSWALSYANQGHTVYCLTSQRGRAGVERALARMDTNQLHFEFVSVAQKLEDKYGTSTFWVYWHYWQWLNNAYKTAQHLSKMVKFNYAHHVSWGSIQQGTSLWRLPIPLVFGPSGGGQFPPKLLKPYFLEGWGIEVKRKLISDLLLKFNRNTRKTLRKSSLILVDNEDTKLLAEKFNNAQTVLINDPNVKVEDIQESFPQRSDSATLRLAWVGRLLYRKGLPLVLEALSNVPADVPVTLSVYGDGPVGEQVPQLIDRLNLSERVVWHGQVPHQEVKEAYRQNDAFIFCPLRETLGEQFFEAMAYGLPIITLNLHGAKTAVPNEGGIKVPVLAQKAMVTGLADAIVYFYQHPEERVAMGKHNFSYIKEIASLNKAKLVQENLHSVSNSNSASLT